MRKSRIQRKMKRRKIKDRTNVPALMLCIFFFAGAGITGVFISEIIVIPYIVNAGFIHQPGNDEPDTTESEVDKTEEKTVDGIDDQYTYNTMVLPPATFYKVQAGAFIDKENAESVRTEIIKSGYGGVVVKDDLHRVYAAAFLERSQADYFVNVLLGKGFEVRVTRWISPNVEIQYTENFNELFNAIEKVMERLIECFEKESKAIYDMKTGSVDRNAFIEKTTGFQDELEGMIVLMEEQHAPEQIRDIYDSLMDIIEHYKAHIGKIKVYSTLDENNFKSLLYTDFLELLVKYELLNDLIQEQE